MTSLSEKLSDKHPLYFEAVLQLRDLSSAALDFVHQELNRAQMKIIKRVKYPNGVDYYLTDQKFTRKLGKLLLQQFGGKFLVTSSLHTKKEGKDVYRFTILFRGILFKKGDKIMYKGEAHEVKALSKDILLQRVFDKKKVHLKWKDTPGLRKV